MTHDLLEMRPRLKHHLLQIKVGWPSLSQKTYRFPCGFHCQPWSSARGQSTNEIIPIQFIFFALRFNGPEKDFIVSFCLETL